MSFIITDKNEVFVGIRLDNGNPSWSGRPDIDHVAQHFVTREEAVKTRDELRAFGVNPKIVDLDKRRRRKSQ